jgi:hypothetical protein
MTARSRYREKCKRWTLDRIDADADVVRVEIVPARSEYDTKGFAEELAASAEEILGWWDVEKAKTGFGSVNWLRSNLLLDKKQPLAEGMVFWVVKKGNRVTKVIHATQAARELSKQMYGRLTREATDGKELSQ